MKIHVQTDYSEAEDITVQYIHEDGYIEDCNHAGAVEEPKEFASYTNWDGMQVPDDSYLSYVMSCDKCPSWLDNDNTWRTD